MNMLATIMILKDYPPILRGHHAEVIINDKDEAYHEGSNTRIKLGDYKILGWGWASEGDYIPPEREGA